MQMQTHMLPCEIWSIIQTNQGNAVLLRPKDMEIAVPIFIGILEMQSILIGKDGIVLPRPLTHDLFIEMLSRVNLNLKKVEIYELKSHTFYARLIITGGEYTDENPLVIDSRPSDAFAIAVRKRYPTYISSTVVEQAGIPLDYFIDAFEKSAFAESDESSDPGKNQHRALLDQLEQAVADEEYERAAEIRDMLKMFDEDDPELH
ncbi:MAG: bifunctional nuclease family protein [Spirochaetes bacterium]|nr:bifunctional nuclease family protein [Spirochaetota bacterium]